MKSQVRNYFDSKLEVLLWLGGFIYIFFNFWKFEVLGIYQSGNFFLLISLYGWVDGSPGTPMSKNSEYIFKN